jgi:hypothetical protein
MSSRHVERWTSAAGIAGTLIQLVAFGVFLIGAGSPPNGEAALAAFLRSGSTALQTSFLLFFVAFAVWFVFFAGLRALITGAGPGLDFLGSVRHGSCTRGCCDRAIGTQPGILLPVPYQDMRLE